MKKCKLLYYLKRSMLFLLLLVLIADFIARWGIKKYTLNISFDDYIKTLISISALLIGLSLIVVYNLFNAHVDNKRKEMFNYIIKNKKDILNIQKEIHEDLNMIKNDIQDKQKNNLLNEEEISFSTGYINNLNNILIDFISPLVKKNSIKYFDELTLQKITLNTRQALNDYYKHLLQHDKIEDLYFLDLELLIKKWNGPKDVEIIDKNQENVII